MAATNQVQCLQVPPVIPLSATWGRARQALATGLFYDAGV